MLVLNKSTVVSDDEVASWVKAIQTQISGDFAKYYGDVRIGFAKTAPASSWTIVVADDSDQAGALGYHLENTSGIPQGFVFAKTDQQFGLQGSVTLSHEVLETIADPFINTLAIDPDGNYRAYEACDAVEADSDGYAIEGIQVSNFVLPEWYNATAPAGTKFDFMGLLTAPFTLRPGGYSSVLTKNGWTQVTAQGSGDSDARTYRVNPYSRKAKRLRHKIA